MDDKMMIDNLPADESKASENKSKTLKRKRASPILENVSAEERESRIDGLRRELDSLFRYFKEVSLQKVHLDETVSCSVNSVFACLLEGSDLPFSKLVDEIYHQLKTKDGISLSSVRSTLLLVGQRSMYGVANPDADVLEDDTDKCLWCWEARDLKVIPKSQRGLLNVWRTGRKKISERVNAVSAMISLLQRPDSHPNYKTDLMKASERIVKVLTESDIRLLLENMVQQSGADMAEKEARLKEKKLIKEMERNKREVEKEKKKMDREHQKEVIQNEKELKRLQDEAEKQERRREKEEAEIKRQLKRQQEEAEKDQRRREKEEADLKKKLAIQKQASIMERFLKIKKSSSSAQDDQSATKAAPSDPSREDLCMHSAATLSMDSTLSLKDSMDTNDLRRSHLDSWSKLGRSIRSGTSRRWGLRHRPKTNLIMELKLQGSSSEAGASGKVTAACKGSTCSDEVSMETLVDDLEESIPRDSLCHTNAENRPAEVQTCHRTKKLLQFDKSYRPAYYGTLSKKSDVIGPRHPLKRDPNLDYDIESDEEWEEEDPGESLSDCDEEETLEEGNARTEDEDGSEDGFVVPDGYLSENEGVQVDSMESDPADDDARSSPRSKPDLEREEFRALFQQQKYICKLTERALEKNRPLFISNLMHEKAELLTAEGLSGISRLEQIYLQALSIRSFPSGPPIEISTCPKASDEDQEAGQSQSSTSVTPGIILQDKDLRKIVWTIQSCTHGMTKLIESLQPKFPRIPKSQLRSKVREISDFVDNRWQVKKEVMEKLGLSISPEKCGQRTKGIAAFFSKRCLPPAAAVRGPALKTAAAAADESMPNTPHKP